MQSSSHLSSSTHAQVSEDTKAVERCAQLLGPFLEDMTAGWAVVPLSSLQSMHTYNHLLSLREDSAADRTRLLAALEAYSRASGTGAWALMDSKDEEEHREDTAERSTSANNEDLYALLAVVLQCYEAYAATLTRETKHTWSAYVILLAGIQSIPDPSPLLRHLYKRRSFLQRAILAASSPADVSLEVNKHFIRASENDVYVKENKRSSDGSSSSSSISGKGDDKEAAVEESCDIEELKALLESAQAEQEDLRALVAAPREREATVVRQFDMERQQLADQFARERRAYEEHLREESKTQEATLRQEAQDKVLELERHVAELQGRLRAQVDQEDRERQELRQELEVLTEGKERLETQVRNLQGEVKTIEERLQSDLKSSRSADLCLQEARPELQHKLEALEEELGRLRDANRHLQSQALDLQDERDSNVKAMSMELHQLRKAAIRQEASEVEWQKASGHLEAEVRRIGGELQAAQQRLESQQQQAEAQAQQARGEEERLEAQAQGAIMEKQQLEERVKELTETVELAALAHLEDKEHEEQLRAELEAAKHEVTDGTRLLAAVADAPVAMEAERKRWRSVEHDYRGQVQALREALQLKEQVALGLQSKLSECSEWERGAVRRLRMASRALVALHEAEPTWCSPSLAAHAADANVATAGLDLNVELPPVPTVAYASALRLLSELVQEAERRVLLGPSD